MPNENQGGFLREVEEEGVLGPLLTSDSSSLVEKQASCITATTSGDSIIVSVAADEVLTLYWITAIGDPDETDTPLIQIFIGSTELYRAYAIAHREKFTGSAGEDLTVTLSGNGSVAITAHYTIT